jgi:hypothetical protein
LNEELPKAASIEKTFNKFLTLAFLTGIEAEKTGNWAGKPKGKKRNEAEME